MGQAYRSVERALYDLGGPPDAQPARPQLRLAPRHMRPGPRTGFRESTRRIDLSLAIRRLTPEEIEVVRGHYILGVRRLSRRERAPIIEKLASLLE